MRLNKNASKSDGIPFNIEEKLQYYREIFDKVIIVEPFTYNLHYSSDKDSVEDCRKKCPLYSDETGCICKDALISKNVKTKITFNNEEAYIVLSKLLKTKYKDLVIVLISQIDSDFSFGSHKKDSIIKQITDINSEIYIDNLTKIYNRNYINKNIDYQIQKALNNHTNLSLACIDIDNFKSFNDTYGHDFGDKVLVSVAQNMKDSVLDVEGAYTVRIGGDEFIIVGIGITKQNFKILMTKLCQLVQSTKLKYNKENIGICISIGVAELIEDEATTYKELYNKADSQLYIAKEAGKNCVR